MEHIKRLGSPLGSVALLTPGSYLEGNIAFSGKPTGSHDIKVLVAPMQTIFYCCLPWGRLPVGSMHLA